MPDVKKRPPVILDHSDEEEERIQRAIADDPDTWEFTGVTADRPTPPVRQARRLGLPDDAFLDEQGRLRARPDLAHLTKADRTVATLPLDRDVFDALRDTHPDDWEAHANALLKKAVGL